MADNGYVYVLMNPSMENLVKIGKTIREPEEKAKELSSTTGVPTPFVVVYSCYFESCSDAEVFVHTYLENKDFRVSSNREFFEIPIKDAIDSVMKAKEHFGEFEKVNQNQDFDEDGIFSSDIEDEFLNNLDYKEKVIEPWQEILDMADIHYYGLNDEIQDYEEAMIYYLQAIKLGSLEAYLQVGKMYQNGDGVSENKTKAMQYYKEGAKKGNANCYGEMAILFEEDENVENTLKCWNKYFELIDKIQEKYGLRYIVFIYEYKLELKYKDKLQPEKNNIISWVNQSINECSDMEYLVEVFEENIRIINLYLKNELKKIETVNKETKSEKVIEKKKSGFFSFFS